MFSVYGVTGLAYRGPLESLGGVSGLSAARHARGIAQEGEELGPELRVRSGSGDARLPDREAAEAYRRMLGREQQREPILHAWQVMSRDVLTLSPDVGVERAWEVLSRSRYGQAPVLDAGVRLVGLVSVGDLLTALNIDDGTVRDTLARTVADVMTSPVVSADPVSDVRRVARVLLNYHLPGLPVVNESGDLAGIISRGDLLRALVNDPPLSLWG
jgi:CBS domain-containing protein